MSTTGKEVLENYFNEQINRLGGHSTEALRSSATGSLKDKRNTVSVKSSLRSGSASSFVSGSSESLTDYRELGNLNELFTKTDASSRGGTRPASRLNDGTGLTSSSAVGIEFLELRQKNAELTFVNRVYKEELERLTNQIALIERKQDLEVQIKDTFDKVVKQKLDLQLENDQLKETVKEIDEKFRRLKLNSEDMVAKLKMQHSNEIFDLELKFKQECNFLSMISQYELKLKEAQIESENWQIERASMIKGLNKAQEEKLDTIEALRSQICHLEKRLENSTGELIECMRSNEALREENIDLKCSQEMSNKLKGQAQGRKQDEIRRLNKSLSLANDKLRLQQLKHQSELNELARKHRAEIERIRTNNDHASSRNAELSRANTELRKRLQANEHEIKELTHKLLAQKQQADSMARLGKDVREEYERKLAELRKEVDISEKVRYEYLEKNGQHQTTIDNMLEQITKLQSEVESLIGENSSLNTKITSLNRLANDYRRKYQAMKSLNEKNEAAAAAAATTTTTTTSRQQDVLKERPLNQEEARGSSQPRHVDKQQQQQQHQHAYSSSHYLMRNEEGIEHVKGLFQDCIVSVSRTPQKTLFTNPREQAQELSDKENN